MTTIFQEGGSFETFNDPQGNPLIKLNRDGTIFTASGITFSDGTTQITAGGSGPAAPTGSIQFNNAGVFGGSIATAAPNGDIQATSIGLGIAPHTGINPAKLTIVGDTSVLGNFQGIEVHCSFGVGQEIYTHATASFRSPVITLFRSRGTQGSPLAIHNGDSIMEFNCNAYDGLVYDSGTPAFAILVSATQDWTPTSHGVQTSFFMTRGGMIEEFPFITLISPDGLIHVAVAGDTPLSTFEVSNHDGVAGGLANAAIGYNNTGHLSPANSLDVAGTVRSDKGFIVTAVAPTVATAQVGIGSTTATSASAGANGDVPAQVVGYLIINVAGTAQKIPYYAV